MFCRFTIYFNYLFIDSWEKANKTLSYFLIVASYEFARLSVLLLCKW